MSNINLNLFRSNEDQEEARMKHLEIERARRKRLGDTFADLDQVCLAAMPRLALQRRDRRNILINSAMLISSLLQENIELRKQQSRSPRSDVPPTQDLCRASSTGVESPRSQQGSSELWRVPASLDFQSPPKRLRRPSMVSNASYQVHPFQFDSPAVTATSPNASEQAELSQFELIMYNNTRSTPQSTGTAAPLAPASLSPGTASRKRFRDQPISSSQPALALEHSFQNSGAAPFINGSIQQDEKRPFASVSDVLLQSLEQTSRSANTIQEAVPLTFNVSNTNKSVNRIDLNQSQLPLAVQRPITRQARDLLLPNSPVGFMQPKAPMTESAPRQDLNLLQQLISHLHSSLPSVNGTARSPIPSSPSSENSFAVQSPIMIANQAQSFAPPSLSSFAPSCGPSESF